MPIQGIAVDLGGVLLLPEPGWDPARIGAHLQVSEASVRESLWTGPEVELANLGHITAEEYSRRAARRLMVGSDGVLALIERLFGGIVNQPLADVLHKLRASYKIAAFTNNWTFVDRLIETHGLARLFDHVVNSADVRCRKPDPCIYAALLARMTLRSEEVIVIDDRPENIETASSLGFLTVLYTTFDTCRLELLRAGVRVDVQ